MSKIIMHIDLNCFFARCHVIEDPSLEGKPLVVAGKSRRGIVSTASYEARKYKINSAMPTYMAMRLCKDLIVIEPNFNLYKKKSDEFFNYVREYSSIIEVASIDECFVDLTEQMKDVKDPENYLKKIQDGLFKKTKLMCSIGLGPTKFLAKMASDMKKPMGITIIRRKDVSKLLWPLPIKDMFGIGKKTYPRLEELGIRTIGDFARDESYEVKKLLGKSYSYFKERVYGKGSDHVQVEIDDPKSIGTSTTLMFDTTDYEEIIKVIHERTESVIRRLKREKKLAYTVTVTIKTYDFISHNKSITLKNPTEDVDVVYNNAVKSFDKMKINDPVRLIGVSVSNLINKEQYTVQMSLFDYQKHNEECKTKIIINEINNKKEKKVLKTLRELKDED